MLVLVVALLWLAYGAAIAAAAALRHEQPFTVETGLRFTPGEGTKTHHQGMARAS